MTAAEDKLRRAAASEASIATFRHHYDQLRAGASGTLPDAELTPVSAMGAALGVFEGAQPLCVPRSRFIPVKSTDDLLALRSDVYALGIDGRVVGGEPPYVSLDPEHYGRVEEFDTRFPSGAPSLVGSERFVVRGDVSFGAGVVARGRVELQGPLHVPDGAVLDGARLAIGI